jgi:hypothetical protein
MVLTVKIADFHRFGYYEKSYLPLVYFIVFKAKTYFRYMSNRIIIDIVNNST